MIPFHFRFSFVLLEARKTLVPHFRRVGLSPTVGNAVILGEELPEIAGKLLGAVYVQVDVLIIGIGIPIDADLITKRNKIVVSKRILTFLSVKAF